MGTCFQIQGEQQIPEQRCVVKIYLPHSRLNPKADILHLSFLEMYVFESFEKAQVLCIFLQILIRLWIGCRSGRGLFDIIGCF